MRWHHILLFWMLFVLNVVLTDTTSYPGVNVELHEKDGWILMQRKLPPSAVTFERDWSDYRDGFGHVSPSSGDNYWLGLKHVHRLVQLGSTSLRIEIKRRHSIRWQEAIYSSFSIGDEAGKYRLSLSGYSGDAGDAMVNPSPRLSANVANGMMFTTRDEDNDEDSSDNCATRVGTTGGWWFKMCTNSILNTDGSGTWKETGREERVSDSRMWLQAPELPDTATVNTRHTATDDRSTTHEELPDTATVNTRHTATDDRSTTHEGEKKDSNTTVTTGYILCDDNPCLDGGTCIVDHSQESGYKCLCLKGHIGKHCELEELTSTDKLSLALGLGIPLSFLGLLFLICCLQCIYTFIKRCVRQIRRRHANQLADAAAAAAH